MVYVLPTDGQEFESIDVQVNLDFEFCVCPLPPNLVQWTIAFTPSQTPVSVKTSASGGLMVPISVIALKAGCGLCWTAHPCSRLFWAAHSAKASASNGIFPVRIVGVELYALVIALKNGLSNRPEIGLSAAPDLSTIRSSALGPARI